MSSSDGHQGADAVEEAGRELQCLHLGEGPPSAHEEHRDESAADATTREVGSEDQGAPRSAGAPDAKPKAGRPVGVGDHPKTEEAGADALALQSYARAIGLARARIKLDSQPGGWKKAYNKNEFLPISSEVAREEEVYVAEANRAGGKTATLVAEFEEQAGDEVPADSGRTQERIERGLLAWQPTVLEPAQQLAVAQRVLDELELEGVSADDFLKGVLRMRLLPTGKLSKSDVEAMIGGCRDSDSEFALIGGTDTVSKVVAC